MEPVSAPQNTDIGEKNNQESKRRKYLVGVIVLLAFTVTLLGVGYGANQVVSNSSVCGSCHEMNPEFYTWQASSHSKVQCTACHLPVDDTERLVRNLAGLRRVVKHFTKTYSTPLKTPTPVSNQNCLACHTLNRKATPSGDLIISHTLHDARGVDCVSCHKFVVHGGISERGKLDKPAPQGWTASMGAKELANHTKPEMLQCLECHRKWKVSNQCENCHKKIPTPPSHQPGQWLELHGRAAWEDVNQCSQCHYDSRLANAKDKKAVAAYIRSNQFCYRCHVSYRPPSHVQTWAHDHASLVQRGEIPYCITCHDTDKSVGNNGKGIITCNNCHGTFKLGRGIIDSV